jgi:cytoskeletal protein RodZ
MTTRKTLMLAALISLAPAGMVMAQSQTTPQDTSPSSASSPHQREATSSSSTESPTSDNTSSNTSSSSPAAASSPHQQQSTHMASKQSMKECVAKQKQDNQGMSSADAKKACKQQMKGSG